MPKKLSDVSKVVRHQKIYNILRHHTDEENAISISEIHSRLLKESVNTSQKTISRDIAEMCISHKIEATEEGITRYYCSGEYEPDYQLTFNESELKTMALALRSLREMSDPFQRSLCEKTEAILLSKFPKDVALDFEKLKSLTIVSPGIRAIAGVDNSEAYKQIFKALWEGKAISCYNYSPYQEKDFRNRLRTFSPLKLNMVGSEQYLIVHDHEDHIIKRLKLCRMKGVKVLDMKIDESLLSKLDNLEACIGGYGGPGMPTEKYTIHCDELMAVLFQEKMIHPSQTITEENGNFKISFEAHPSIEIARYLAGWAKHISYIEPHSLLDEMNEIWDAGVDIIKNKKAA